LVSSNFFHYVSVVRQCIVYFGLKTALKTDEELKFVDSYFRTYRKDELFHSDQPWESFVILGGSINICPKDKGQT
jgi:hypothetical protein